MPTIIMYLNLRMIGHFGIVLALVNSANGLLLKGFLLINEIENGLHWSVKNNVWKLIFEVARRLNVQVFATTHNKDCIDAFEEVASASNDMDGHIIRLEKKGDKIVVVDFQGDELFIVRKHDIEVR